MRAAELKEGAQLRTTELKEGAQLKATELKEGVHLRAAGLMAGAQLRAAGLKEEAAARITQEAEEIPAAVAEKIRALSQRRQELLQARRHLSSHMSLYMKGIIKGNPTASSKRFGEALEELREILEQKSDNTRR